MSACEGILLTLSLVYGYHDNSLRWCSHHPFRNEYRHDSSPSDINDKIHNFKEPTIWCRCTRASCSQTPAWSCPSPSSTSSPPTLAARGHLFRPNIIPAHSLNTSPTNPGTLTTSTAPTTFALPSTSPTLCTSKFSSKESPKMLSLNSLGMAQSKFRMTCLIPCSRASGTRLKLFSTNQQGSRPVFLCPLKSIARTFRNRSRLRFG